MAKMNNNIDLIHAILKEVGGWTSLEPRQVEIPGYDPLLVARHVERLTQDGLIDGVIVSAVLGREIEVDVRDLTSAGHNFLAALNQQVVWEKIKNQLKPSELAALSVAALAKIATDLVLQEVRKKVGL